MGRPKPLRSLRYFAAASRAARATPTAPAAIPIRPLFRVLRIWFHPSPRVPTRFSFGIRQSSNARSAVGLARRPSFVFVSTFVTLNPGASLGTMNREMPSWRFVPGSRAYTWMRSEMLPFEMNRFRPLRTHSSPSSVAVVERFEAALPAPRPRLREGPGSDLLPAREGHEPRSLLPLVPEPEEGRLAQGRLDGDRRADARGAAADLLHEEHEGDGG